MALFSAEVDTNLDLQCSDTSYQLTYINNKKIYCLLEGLLKYLKNTVGTRNKEQVGKHRIVLYWDSSSFIKLNFGHFRYCEFRRFVKIYLNASSSNNS